jgi:hypothetical protein
MCSSKIFWRRSPQIRPSACQAQIAPEPTPPRNLQKPKEEAERLAALREYHVLDTVAEKAYDDITLLAAHICQVPIAMISLVDEARQWFKSKVGVKTSETAREVAFCSRAILRSDPLIVTDALKDRRSRRMRW